jgi:hypothetical protein
VELSHRIVEDAMPSSVIQFMQYDPQIREVLIVFCSSRGTYRYFDVPMDEWKAFRKAPSKGTYLNEVFKPKHRYEKVAASERMHGEAILRWPDERKSPGTSAP